MRPFADRDGGVALISRPATGGLSSGRQVVLARNAPKWISTSGRVARALRYICWRTGALGSLAPETLAVKYFKRSTAWPDGSTRCARLTRSSHLNSACLTAP